MPTYESTQIRVKPFVVGAPRDGYVVLRTLDEPKYISLTLTEWKVLQRLADLELTLDAYVKWHLAGRDGLSFHQALQLLLRLQKAGFFEEVFSEGVMQRLEELESQGRRAYVVALQRGSGVLSRALDFVFKERVDFNPPAKVIAFFRALMTTEGVLAAFAVLAVLAVRSHFSWARALTVLSEPLSNPLFVVLELAAWFSVAGMALGFLEGALLKTDPRALVPWSFRFTSGFFVRVHASEDHALLVDRAFATRYFALSIAAPWFGTFALWWGATLFRAPGLYVGSFAFTCLALAKLCPLYRSSIVRFAESYAGSQNLLATAKDYLNRKIFAGLIDRNKALSIATPKSVEHATHVLAAVAFAWLYVCGLAFFDLFGRSFTILATNLVAGPLTLQFWPSLLLVLVNISVVLSLVFAFGWIVMGNVAAVAQVPLRRARRGLSSFKRGNASSVESLLGFLKDNPVFSDLPASVLEQLAQSFKLSTYRRGETIVEQGESGEEFFVLADGDAQVVLEQADGSFDIVALLHPGDSFGEVALVAGTLRTATVRAASKCSVLSLHRNSFDLLFPEGSSLRNNLSNTLRHVKLIQESQALSHLSPRQVRELLAIAEQVTFAPDAPIVTEGENAEHAYVLVSGTAKVCHHGDNNVIARLGAGDLVGIIGIIKASRRNADVIAETEVRALKLERDSFLKLCMMNIFVAILIANLSENQVTQSAKFKKPA